jgi:hypothetical protein
LNRLARGASPSLLREASPKLLLQRKDALTQLLESTLCASLPHRLPLLGLLASHPSNPTFVLMLSNLLLELAPALCRQRRFVQQPRPETFVDIFDALHESSDLLGDTFQNTRLSSEFLTKTIEVGLFLHTRPELGIKTSFEFQYTAPVRISLLP